MPSQRFEGSRWLPPEPENPSAGAVYGIVRGGDGWEGYVKLEAPTPVDSFIPGWSFLPFSGIPELLTVGAVHAAVSFGAQAPQLGAVAFERTAANTSDVDVPTAGWAGTNWLIQRASSAPTPPTFGNNTGRLETTAFNDLPDPSFGEIANAADFCRASLRRNSYITISDLTVGDRYYYAPIFATYPDSRTRACRIQSSDGGPSVAFGVDGVDSILQKAVRRYGFIANGSSISFLKAGPDNNGAYQNGFIVLNLGADQ